MHKSCISYCGSELDRRLVFFTLLAVLMCLVPGTRTIYECYVQRFLPKSRGSCGVFVGRIDEQQQKKHFRFEDSPS